MENKELEKKNAPMELDDDALDTVTGGTAAAPEEDAQDFSYLLKPIHLER